MDTLHRTATDDVPLIDHRALPWPRVQRLRYFCYQRFHYSYPGPVRHLKQRLVVVPLERYGDQRLHEQQLTVTPFPARARCVADRYGNSVWSLEVDYIEREIAFEVLVTVERRAEPTPLPTVPASEARRYLQPTRLTTADGRITEVARELSRDGDGDGLALAQRISDWVADAMSYGSGSTGVSTTAAEALAIGRGLCQDYAHIMLAICRVAGLPARYVSGHMLGEGGSHAWVEVLLPDQNNGALCPVGFDPTNRRQPNLGYTVVAVGRDYGDVPPTSGSYTAPYGGQLQFTKRAGLTLAELDDGTLVAPEQTKA